MLNALREVEAVVARGDAEPPHPPLLLRLQLKKLAKCVKQLRRHELLSGLARALGSKA